MKIRVRFTGESWGERKGKEEDVEVTGIASFPDKLNWGVDNSVFSCAGYEIEEAKPIMTDLPEGAKPRGKEVVLGVNEYAHLLSVANQMLGFIIGTTQLSEKAKSQFQYWEEMINEATGRLEEALR